MSVKSPFLSACRLSGVLLLLSPVAAMANGSLDGRDTAPTTLSPRTTVIAQAAKPKTDAAATNPDGKVTLLNCSGRAITVKSFDANDNEMVVPEQTNAIADGQALTVNCNTSDCKLTIENIKTAPVAGPLVYTKGKVTPSDQATVAKGCGAFK